MTDTYVISDSGKATILKDPNATLDYTWDWTLWLDDIVDTISAKVVTVDSPLVLVSSNIVGKKVVAFISGGVAGATYKAVCEITTAGGRIDDRTIYIKIKER